MSREEWRPLPGAEWYRISDQGRIWSLRGERAGGREVFANPAPCGMRTVNLQLPDGSRIRSSGVRVGTLVARAFLGERPRGMRVRYLNGNPLDDRLSNIAYGTLEEFKADMVARARREEASGETPTHCPAGHRYADSWLSNYGERFCPECRWEDRQAYKDTDPHRTTCEDCGEGLPPSSRRRRRCETCAARSPYVTGRCFDCGERLPTPPPGKPGPRAKRCAVCRKVATNAASKAHSARKRAALPEPEPRISECVDCGTDLTAMNAATGPIHKRCPECKKAAALEASRRFRERKRAARVAAGKPGDAL